MSRRLSTYLLLFTSYFLLPSCAVVLKDPVSILGMEHRPSKTATFTRAEAIDELETVARLIDRVHSDPYRYQSRDIFDAERRRLIETMPASLTRTELCLRLARLVATLDDGHSGLNCQVLVGQQWEKDAKAS